MPKVIRTRNLISAGEVEIPDQVLPVPMEIPADPEEGAEAPEAQAAPQPDPEQTRRAAEELFRSRLEQMQTQAEETSGKILRHAGEERERILQSKRRRSAGRPGRKHTRPLWRKNASGLKICWEPPKGCSTSWRSSSGNILYDMKKHFPTWRWKSPAR